MDNLQQTRATIDISICIVSYNTRDLLRDCLKSIQLNTHETSYEIIVADNNSEDGTQEMLSQDFPEIKTIYNNDNKGFAKATNQAIKIAKGEYILLLNPDTIILEKAIDRSLQFLKEQKDDDIVTCRLLNQDGTIQKIKKGGNFYSLKVQLFMHLNLSKIMRNSTMIRKAFLQDFDYNKTQKVCYIAGCFMLLKKSTLLRIGLLDEDYFLYSEDADLCYRVRKAGGNIHYFSNAEIIHYKKESTLQVNLIAYHQFITNRFKFYRKNYGYFKAVSYRFILALGTALTIIRLIPDIFYKRENVNRTSLKKHLNTLLWATGFMRSKDHIEG